VTQDALAFLAERADPVRMVIFDCDGVLIDSEALCDRVVAASLTELGWAISAEDCHRRFLGWTFHDMVPAIERVSAVFAAEVEPVPGAWEALTGTTALGLPWRIASNSSHTEMAAKFSRVGWAALVEGRVHSATAIIARGGRGKPAPDVFLEAAAAEGVAPAHCLVIEDSVAGALAARAAGMACLGYCPDHDGKALRAAGAVPFRPMHAIPALLRGDRAGLTDL
jgi:HAD superfamily hydrolase (TIGR01509 family)